MKKTTARTKFNPTAFIICIILYIIILAAMIFWIISAWQAPITDTGFYQSYAAKVLSIAPPSFIIILLIIGLFSSLVGHLRAQSQVHRANRAIKLKNPYQYYKELPNDFGIGVASLLANSTIENEKDIVAAILDLCAQKYLRLSKHSDHYVIRLEPTPQKTPLSNEDYLINLIKTNQLPSIDYQKWYDLCVADGIQLGLYQPIKFSSHKPSTQPKFRKTRIALGIGLALLAFGFLAVPFLPIPNLGYTLFGLGIIVSAASGVFLYVGTVTAGIARISQQTIETSYKSTLEKQLVKTSKGIEEFQKLYAFRAFLAQFHIFVDKDPEAVVLWDRYLSYAQVFGLANELMHTGYAQLIDNAAFKIDDINHISLKNITEIQ